MLDLYKQLMHFEKRNHNTNDYHHNNTFIVVSACILLSIYHLCYYDTALSYTLLYLSYGPVLILCTLLDLPAVMPYTLLYLSYGPVPIPCTHVPSHSSLLWHLLHLLLVYNEGKRIHVVCHFLYSLE